MPPDRLANAAQVKAPEHAALTPMVLFLLGMDALLLPSSFPAMLIEFSVDYRPSTKLRHSPQMKSSGFTTCVFTTVNTNRSAMTGLSSSTRSSAKEALPGLSLCKSRHKNPARHLRVRRRSHSSTVRM